VKTCACGGALQFKGEIADGRCYRCERWIRRKVLLMQMWQVATWRWRAVDGVRFE